MPILKKRGLTKFLVVVALVAAAGIGWYILETRASGRSSAWNCFRQWPDRSD